MLWYRSTLTCGIRIIIIILELPFLMPCVSCLMTMDIEDYQMKDSSRGLSVSQRAPIDKM
jgi:hypothetical protein